MTCDIEDGSVDPAGYVDWVVSGVARFVAGKTLMGEFGVYGPGFNATARKEGGVTTLLDGKGVEPYSRPEKVFGDVSWIDWERVSQK